MASHGRRHASAETIERKKAKKAMRKANARLRKIDGSIYSTDKNPGIYAYRQAGKPKDFFKLYHPHKIFVNSHIIGYHEI